MLKKIAIVVLALVLVVSLLAARQPDSFHVERSVVIEAPPERVQALIDDFHAWSRWSPYEKLDPAMTRTFDGAPRGQGAVYSWSGNAKAGAGRMEITEATPSKVAIKLDFTEPMASSNVAQFRIVPQGNAVNVTWAMDGPNSAISKVMSVFVSMDRLLGGDFEQGLASLKAEAEKPVATSAR